MTQSRMTAAAVGIVCILAVATCVAAQYGHKDGRKQHHLDHDEQHEYEVEFTTKDPLGLLLDERLEVTGFQRTPRGEMMPAEATGWINVGDRMVSVNAITVEHMNLRQLADVVSKASLPRLMRFHTRRHNDRVEQLEREMAAFASNQQAEGRLLMVHHDLPQGNFSFVQALFGGPPACTPLPLMTADPPHACGELLNEEQLAGAVVVVERGMCAYSDKAMNVQMAGGAGIIVLNDKGPAFRMPCDTRQQADVFVSAVMVSEDTAVLVRHVMQTGMQPLEVQLLHDDRWCKETRNVSEELVHPDAVQRANHTEVHELKEFDSGHLVLFADDNPELVPGSARRYEYLRAEFGAEPVQAAMVEVDEYESFRASNYMIPEGHEVNVTANYSTPEGMDHGASSGRLQLIAAQPLTACEPLRGMVAAEEGATLAVLVSRGQCAFEVKQRHVAAAGGSVMVAANDRLGLTHMGASSPDKVVDDVAAVMITESAGSSLRGLLREAYAEGVPLYMRFVGNQAIKAGWGEIQKLLEHPHLWPRKTKSRRKVYFRLSRLHHPDKQGGSDERFEALTYAYRLGNHHYNPSSEPLDL